MQCTVAVDAPALAVKGDVDSDEDFEERRGSWATGRSVVVRPNGHRCNFA